MSKMCSDDLPRHPPHLHLLAHEARTILLAFYQPRCTKGSCSNFLYLARRMNGISSPLAQRMDQGITHTTKIGCSPLCSCLLRQAFRVATTAEP